MKNQTYIIIGVIIFFLAAIFAVTNVDPVQVTYFFWTGQSPLIYVILFSILLGCLITAVIGTYKYLQLKRQMKSLHNENKTLETIIHKYGSKKLKDELERLRHTENDEAK